MIDTAIERTYPLAKAARMHASSRGVGTVHPGTLHRWRLYGIGGIKLECLKVGGSWHTSQGALQRFFEQLTAAEQTPAAAETHPPNRRTSPTKQPGHEDRHNKQVEAELDAVLGGGLAINTRK